MRPRDQIADIRNNSVCVIQIEQSVNKSVQVGGGQQRRRGLKETPILLLRATLDKFGNGTTDMGLDRRYNFGYIGSSPLVDSLRLGGEAVSCRIIIRTKLYGGLSTRRLGACSCSARC